MSWEHVFLARMLEATARVIPYDCWRYLMVDGLGTQPRLALRQALEAELSKHRFHDGEPTFSVKTPEEPQQRQSSLCNTTDPPTSGCPVPEAPKAQWNEHLETPGSQPWRRP